MTPTPGNPLGAPLFIICTVPVGTAPLLVVLIVTKQLIPVPASRMEGRLQLARVVVA